MWVWTIRYLLDDDEHESAVQHVTASSVMSALAKFQGLPFGFKTITRIERQQEVFVGS